jgi:hypothetical protein
VQIIARDNLAVIPDAATAARGPSGVIFQRQTIRTGVITTEAQLSSGAAALPAASAVRIPKLWKVALPLLLIALLVVIVRVKASA